MLVPVTTIYDDDVDYSCTIRAGAHCRITHDSYVDYRQAKLIPVQDLMSRVSRKLAKKVEPASEIMLKEMWAGAGRAANMIPHGCRSVLFKQGFCLSPTGVDETLPHGRM